MTVVAAVAIVGATAAAAPFAAGDLRTAGGVVVADFATAAPLVDGNQVKIDGVVVGKVLALEARDDHADVVMALNPSAFPLHTDATVMIRSVSLLGERYLDLERGSPDAPLLKPGDSIPMAQTSTTVGIDQILNELDEPTAEGLAAVVTTLGDGLRDNGANADATIRALAPALRDTQALAEVLEEQNALLNNLVDRAEPVAGALAADDGRAMDQLVGSAERLLATTAARQEAFEATLAELPGALQSARTTLARLEGAAQGAEPTLRGIRPVTDDLERISAELIRFADSLDPALASTEPVLERAKALLDEARPVAADLRAAGPELRSTAESARPIVEDLTADLDSVLTFVRNWALSTKRRDGLSHYLVVNLIVNEASLTGHLPAGAAPQSPLPSAQDVAPDLPALPGLPPVAPLLQPPAPAGTPSDAGGVTGLTPEQESDLTGFLLGGGS